MNFFVTWPHISGITCYLYMCFPLTYLGIRPCHRNASVTEFNDCGCCVWETETHRRAGPEHGASVLCNNQKGDAHIYELPRDGTEVQRTDGSPTGRLSDELLQRGGSADVRKLQCSTGILVFYILAWLFYLIL
jgi:hypothetical protein